MTQNMYDAKRRFVEATKDTIIARAKHTHLTWLVDQANPLDPDYGQIIVGWEDATLELMSLEAEVVISKQAIVDLNTAERAARDARHAMASKPHGGSVHKGLKAVGWFTMVLALCSGHHTPHRHP